jgi:uncharacterized protein YndB with AHSA1/START domain
MTTLTAQTTQVYSIVIKATPEQVWDAITKPEFTHRYFYGTLVSLSDAEYISRGPVGNEMIRGAVLEIDPPQRLVHAWRSLWDPEQAKEDESRVAWEIEPQDGGITKLTVVHDRLEGAPKTAASVAGGWVFVLSGLKTLLETGEPLTA